MTSALSPQATQARSQLELLDALISAAAAAREAARKDRLFASYAGLALVNAAFDVFETDGLYDLAQDIGRDLGVFDNEPLMPSEAIRSRLYSNLIGGEMGVAAE